MAMGRRRRYRGKIREAQWFHVYSKAACYEGEYPLQQPGCARQLQWFIQRYTEVYFCRVGAFSIMGNHYHVVVQMEAPRPLDEGERWARARLLYPDHEEWLQTWSEEKWQRFEKRLFDISELMRNIQMMFGRWYNQTFRREGRFWGNRFKSTVLANPQAVLDCCLYVDLNAVRAGLVKRPGSDRFE
jgi:REP element-mobilizing transposase RayT